MRYYSDELKKFFDTEESLLAEEEKARVEAEEKKVTKAKLAKAVEDADKALELAYEDLNKAKEEVAKLQKEYEEQKAKLQKKYDEMVDALMNPALDNIKECNKVRAEAIKAFNDKFGVYTTTYTGNKALNEMVKMEKIFDNIFKRFYW